MIEKWNSRTELLIGKEAINILKHSKVIVYGIGGVGSFVVEGLVRAGIGKIVLVDNDIISISNLNRQIYTNINNIGQRKIDAIEKRILSINPDIIIDKYMKDEILKGEESLIDDTFSYVIDCVDTVNTKIKLIEKANKVKVPIISAMGTGNKIEPTKLEVTDINKTLVCPLAKVIRKELRKRNIKNLKVVYSKEEPRKRENKEQQKNVIGSIIFVPAVAGLIISSEVVKDIIENNQIN